MISRGGDRPRDPLARAVLFDLGALYMTSGVQEAIPPSQVATALRRHAQGDWGTLGDEDRRANDRAIKDGGRLLSAYDAADGTRFWIITEADRSVTTVLLPSEY